MLKFISLTSDFGVQSQSVGVMEATALRVAPDARVIHLMHGLPTFNIIAAARTLEAICYLPVGNHVCVCDPGVGTARKKVIISVGRGDHLIGPDNGVLIPASRLLGGITEVREISNQNYMLKPVSSIFHGRDIFVPAAAHLTNGVETKDFGQSLQVEDLAEAPYAEAEVINNVVTATVIQINYFGSLHLNMTHQSFDSFGVNVGDNLQLSLPNGSMVNLAAGRTFGDVQPGEAVILKDDYGRVEIAINLGAFTAKYQCKIGDQVQLRKTVRLPIFF